MNTPTLFEDSVYIDNQHQEAVTTTRIIAAEMDRDHSKVLRLTENLIKRGSLGKAMCGLSYYLSSQSKKSKMYVLNEEATMRLIMSMSGEKAEVMKDYFTRKFFEQKNTLLSWNKHREKTKIETKTANDMIEDFVRYAEHQRGKPYEGVSPYRLMFHRAIAKSVVGYDRSYRDTLPKEYLQIIEHLEEKVSGLLAFFMSIEAEYHYISKHVLRHIKESAAETLKDFNLCRYDARATPKQQTLF